MMFLVMLFSALLCACASDVLVVKIVQTNAVIDPHPVLNLFGVQFLLDGKQSILSDDDFSFREPSADYPAYNCNVGFAGNEPEVLRMCQSVGNTFTPTLTVVLEGVMFDRIKVFNAQGLNTTFGEDIGQRIVGATLSVSSRATKEILYSYDFDTQLAVYDLVFPVTGSWH